MSDYQAEQTAEENAERLREHTNEPMTQEQLDAITRISRDTRFTIVDSGEHEGTRWVSATIPGRP